KDGDVRTVPISPALHALLREARDRDPDGAMVLPRDGVGRTNIWRDFQVLFKRAGVTPYSKPMHSLRKSCITDWARTNPSHVVQQWAGHSDYRTTAQHYLQVSVSDYRKAAGLPLEDAGGRGGPPVQGHVRAHRGDRLQSAVAPPEKKHGPRGKKLGGSNEEPLVATEGVGHSTGGDGLPQNLPQNPESDPPNRRNSRAGEGI